jgi:DNA-binding transcriptional regulator YbjK
MAGARNSNGELQEVLRECKERMRECLAQRISSTWQCHNAKSLEIASHYFVVLNEKILSLRST